MISDTTIASIMMILAADPPVTRSDHDRLQQALRDAGHAPDDRVVISIKEAARRIGRSPATVHALARRSIVFKIRLPGYKQSSGVRKADIDRYCDYLARRYA